jgi:hypothetical protein
MALVVKDRVRETSTSTGTGDIILNGAVQAFQDFSVIGDGNTTYYTIVDATTGAFEVGIGTYTLATTTLSRDTVLESSNAGAAVNFAANVKDVFVTYPAERAVYGDAGNVVSGYTISGGSINNTPIGAITPSTGSFSSLVATTADINGGSIDGTTVGASTPSTVASTNLSYTGTLTGGTGVINIGSGQVYKDASGNLGIGTSSPTASIPLTILSNSGNAIAMNVRGRSDGIGVVLFSDNADAENGRIDFRTNYAEIKQARNAPLILSTNSAERVRIDSAGDVNIGAAADAGNTLRYLDLYNTNTGASAGSIIRFITSNAAASGNTTVDMVKYKSGGFILNNNEPSSAAFTAFGIGGSERARITSTGSVGIGTSAPSTAFYVYRTDADAVGTFQGLQTESGGTGKSAIQIDVNGKGGFAIANDATSGTRALTISNNSGYGVSTVEAMRITSTGSVGIGTSSPTMKLDISGTSYGGVYIKSTSTNYSGISLENTNSATKWQIGVEGGTYHTAGKLNIGIDAVGSAIIIDSSRNVGIGTSSPAAKLDVVGGMNLSGQLTAGASGSVFSPLVSAGYISGTSNMYLRNISGTNRIDSYNDPITATIPLQLNASQHTFYIADAEKVRIDSSGNVGIGTSSPLGKLKVLVGDNAPAASGDMNTGVIVETGYGARAINFGVNNTAGYSWINAAFSNNSGVADNLVLMTGATERLRIDSSGNVGLGVTPSAWDAGIKAIQINNQGAVWSISSANPNVAVTSNARLVGATYSYVNTGVATQYAQSSGQHQFFTAPSGTAGDAISFTQAMTLDASGNLGIGTSSPSTKLTVVSGTNGGIAVNDGTVNTIVYNSTGGVASIGTTTNHPVDFYTNNAARVRIDTSGNLLVGTTSEIVAHTFVSGNVNGTCSSRNTNTTAGQYFRFGHDQNNNFIVLNQASAGVYLTNGGTTWTSLSDERTKDIIEPIANAAEKVVSLRAVIGKYKTDEDGVRRAFLIAQDVQAVLPEAVNTDKDGTLGLNYTDVIPLLTAALQELKAELDTVKAELNTLKGN